MKHRSLDVSCWYFLTLIIFVANISFSFAKAPSYACFKLAHGYQEQRYDIYINDKLELRRITEYRDGGHDYDQAAGTGWAIPEAPFKIMDKSGKNGVEIAVKVHPVTMRLSRRCACIFDICIDTCYLFSKQDFGYFVAARAIGKGLNITGCGNASSGSEIYGRFVARNADQLLHEGYGQCCILSIAP